MKATISSAAVAAMLLALSTSSVAQDNQQVIMLPFFGYDTQSVDASVVSANAEATTLALACPPGTDSNDCGLFPMQTMTVGPSTYAMYMSAADFTGTQVCTTYGTSSAVCSESNGGSSANFPGSSTTTYEQSDLVNLPVTITAGADKLSEATSAATNTVSSSASASSGASPASSNGGQASSTSSATPSSTSNAAHTDGITSNNQFSIMGLSAAIFAYLAL